MATSAQLKDIIDALKDKSQSSEDIISRIEASSIPFYLFPLIVMEAAPDKLIDVNITVDSQNALHCILKLSDEDIKSAQETLSEGQKRKVAHDTHKTRVDIASSLVKLGCSITKEDKNKLSPWGVVTKPKNEELQNVLLESEHIEEVTLESNRSLYVDFETSLNSRDAAAEKGKDEDEGSAEVYVGFLSGEAKMLAVKFLQFKNEKKFMDEVNNMKSVRSSNHVLNYRDSVIVKPKGRSKTKEGYIVMEKADYTVSDVIKRRKGAGSGDEETEEAFRINILEQTVDALVYIHKKDGILHRDLKPDNIFVVEDERSDETIVKLGDLGASKQLHRNRVTKTKVRGQCDFLAPEFQNLAEDEVVELHAEIHYTVDMFSLGIVAGMLFGEGHNIFHLPGEFESKIRSNITDGKKNLDAIKNSKYKNRIAIANFVDACTQHDPAKRPTAEECKDHELFKALVEKATRYTRISAHVKDPSPLQELYNSNAPLVIGGKGHWLHPDIMPTPLQKEFCPKGNYIISKTSDVNTMYRNMAQHAGENPAIMLEVYKTPNPTNVQICEQMNEGMVYKTMHDRWFEKEKINNDPDKFTSIYFDMETADCEEKLRTEQILPLKETNTITLEVPPSPAKVEAIKATKGRPMAIIKYPMLKSHVQQSLGNNVNFEMRLRADGEEKPITEKPKKPDKSKVTNFVTEIFEGSHVIAKMLNTTFTAVCKQPDLNKAFDVEHSTSLSKIKEEILVDLAARGLEVEDVTFRKGGKDVKLDQAVSKAGIADGGQLDVVIELKVPKTRFLAICRNPEVKMDFNVKNSTKLTEIKDNIMGQLAAGTLQVDDVTLCRGVAALNLDDSVSEAGILEGGQVHLRIKRKQDLPPASALSRPYVASRHPSPLVPPAQFLTSVPWPGAYGHLLFVLNGEIHLWGGCQTFSDSSSYLPPHLLWRFQPESDSFLRLETSGDIPPARGFPCAATIDDVLYVFGGSDADRASLNDLHSFNPATRKWKRETCAGESPEPRSLASCWAEKEDFFVFGGHCKPRASEKYLEGGEKAAAGRTNQLAAFSTKNKRWRDVQLIGARPAPRCDAAVAKVGELVYIMGGNTAGGDVNDLWCIDLTTMRCTEIKATTGATPGPREGHSLTAITEQHLVLVGGVEGGSVFADVWTLDVASKAWTQEEEIPRDGDKPSGRLDHRAVCLNKRLHVFGGLGKDIEVVNDFITFKVAN